MRSVGFLTCALAFGSCGNSPPVAPGDGCADAAPDTSAECALDLTGSFVFHVHNAGTAMLVLDLGCGKTPPIAMKRFVPVRTAFGASNCTGCPGYFV